MNIQTHLRIETAMHYSLCWQKRSGVLMFANDSQLSAVWHMEAKRLCQSKALKRMCHIAFNWCWELLDCGTDEISKELRHSDGIIRLRIVGNN